MISMVEFKKACNGILSQTYPELTIYGKETTDGYQRPSFFTELLSHGGKHESKTFARNGATFKVTLLEKTPDEALTLEVADKIREAFGMSLKVGNRTLLIGDITFDYVGEYNNILQVSVDFDWYESKPRKETEEIMAEVDLALNKKGEQYGSTKY